jgi:hypothetical protein
MHKARIFVKCDKENKEIKRPENYQERGKDGEIKKEIRKEYKRRGKKIRKRNERTRRIRKRKEKRKKSERLLPKETANEMNSNV